MKLQQQMKYSWCYACFQDTTGIRIFSFQKLASKRIKPNCLSRNVLSLYQETESNILWNQNQTSFHWQDAKIQYRLFLTIHRTSPSLTSKQHQCHWEAEDLCRMGIPTDVVSDDGGQLGSTVFKDFAKENWFVYIYCKTAFAQLGGKQL